VDVVLSDLRLAGEDTGLRVLQALRALHPQAKMALITGDTAPDRLREAQAAGVPLLHKPVSLGALLSVLADAPPASPSP
jgi:CheY-like chemotaxis protein